MMERSIGEECFRVWYVPSEEYAGYLCLLRVSVVTIGGLYPIGIKVVMYDPCQVSERGFFIDIDKNDWSI